MLEYRFWKELSKSKDIKDMNMVLDFEKSYPSTAREYKERLKAEHEQRDKIMKTRDREKRLRAIGGNLELFGIDRTRIIRE